MVTEKRIGLPAKILRRIREPDLIQYDVQRFYTYCRDGYIRYYASYHEKRGTPGRAYRIPGRYCKMWLPISWGMTVVQRRFGLFEPWTFETLERVVRPGMIAVELGACYGEFTIHLSRLVGPTGTVYSFEPFPKYFSITQRNVELNNLTNVVLLNRAVGNGSVQEVSFDLEAVHPYGSLDQISGLDYSQRAQRVDPAHDATVKVKCIALSSFLRERRIKMDLLFMDIEGCEVRVLEDIQNLLNGDEKKPIVYFERHGTFYRPGDMEWIEDLFRQARYSVELIRGNYLLCIPEK